MIELQKRIEQELKTGRSVVVGIDGNCCAGKSTLAQVLASNFDCNVFHMDDFYLNDSSEPMRGALEGFVNADVQRFKSQVLSKLGGSEPFVFQKYVCKSGEFINNKVEQKKLNIVEGTYSLCPELCMSYDIKVFVGVSKHLQMERLARRETPESFKQFVEKWLVYEKRYFDFYNIFNMADIRLEL